MKMVNKETKLKTNEMWFAVAMIILIFSITIGSALIANCMLLDEICKK